jgi:hypothetical protein
LISYRQNRLRILRTDSQEKLSRQPGWFKIVRQRGEQNRRSAMQLVGPIIAADMAAPP